MIDRRMFWRFFAVLALMLAIAAAMALSAHASFADAARTPLAAEISTISTAAARKPLAAEASTITASWYGGSGERLASHTASGARFDPRRFTAAHRTLPFGTRLRVSLGSRSVIVTVNDRGPARWTHRALDLSRAAAASLHMLAAGVARVTIHRL